MGPKGDQNVILLFFAPHTTSFVGVWRKKIRCAPRPPNFYATKVLLILVDDGNFWTKVAFYYRSNAFPLISEPDPGIMNPTVIDSLPTPGCRLGGGGVAPRN